MEVPPPTAEPLRQLNLPSGAAVQNTNKCEEENMKRKTMALMLALSMCLSLLSACGSGNTATDDKPPESENVVSSTEQPEESEKPEESKEQPEESEEPKEEEPEESEEESGSPTAAFLALLRNEYENGGPLWGESASHVCVKLPTVAFTDGEDIFISEKELRPKVWYRYNTVTKELSEPLLIENPNVYVDGLFYCYDSNDKRIEAYDKNGALMYSEELGEDWYDMLFAEYVPLEKGFIINGPTMAQAGTQYVTGLYFSYDLKEQHIIPMPEKEVGHGIKEPLDCFDEIFSVDGDAYGIKKNYNSDGNTVYKLNAGTWQWEEFDTVDDDGYYRMTGTNGVYESFYGRYVYSKQGVFDTLTGEEVFTFDEQYPVPHSSTRQNYITDHGVYITWMRTHRLVDLHSSGITEKWARPEKIDGMSILDGTYLVYCDEYGCFLWNALDGTEETIMLFEN